MNKIKQILFSGLLVLSGATAGAVGVVTSSASALECGGAQTAIIECSQSAGGSSVEDTGVWALLVIAINILSVGVGVVAVAGVVWGSILYTSAGGNSEQVKKARGIITNVVVGLLAYVFMYAIINFIIPGGLF